MNLFVQVAFDLEDCKRPEYDAVEGWLERIGLRRSLHVADNTEVSLPANTFAGFRDCYSNREEAIKHVQEMLAMAAHSDFCTGNAFITVSLAAETTFNVHRFKL